MKKYYASVLVILVFISVQPVSAQNVQIGGIFGLNIANLDIEGYDLDDGKLNSRIGLGIGAVLDIPINENLLIRVEPMFIQKGAKDDITETDYDFDSGKEIKVHGEIELNLSYIEIPVLFKVPIDISTYQPFIIAGPTIGVLMSAEAVLTANGEEETEDIKDNIKNIDFGICLGGGVSYPIGLGILFFEARYTLGLSDINDTEDDGEVKTKGFQIMAGITFPLSGQ